MQNLVDTAETGFSSTTGFSIGNLISWSVDNLVKLWVGSGVAVLYELRYVIVMFIIISIGLYFAFRALGFFKH